MAVAARVEAAAGTPDVIDRLLPMRAAAKFATDVALDIATWAYRNGGARALRLDHPVQRILRDLLGATQHVFVDDKFYAQYGTVLLGGNPRGERPLRRLHRLAPRSAPPGHAPAHPGHGRAEQRCHPRQPPRAGGHLGRGRCRRGAGGPPRGTDGVFCGGGDVSFLPPLVDDPDRRASVLADIRQLVLGAVRCEKPIIAAVEGFCSGAGLALAVIAGITVAARSTTSSWTRTSWSAWPAATTPPSPGPC